eukprot:CAMPEP_0201592610 /NCGR_PEP_ID=MMETSP0190_2-20130828/190463_1 /ASSEMBLY_ACC=CAM_ASM_000263 /TAXON_ID=37353 /ORGANISM="Rosalina sp." /LENGTH=51 /DNA_ID=CAMNT_0048051469 /DNA_START=230 /DNA_END=385 /DNA_ORIENTATION=+
MAALEMYQLNISEQEKAKQEEEDQYYACNGEYYPPGWDVDDMEEDKPKVDE